jgi:hypothetical protein
MSIALGWAILPFSVALALGGLWADGGRDTDKHRMHLASQGGQVSQSQRAGDWAQQLQVGHDYKINEK